MEWVWISQTDSTNRVAKELARQGAPQGTAVVAQSQTAGRGRLGRQFFSPEGGLYLSVVLRPALPPEQWSLLTPMAAVAVCRAVEQTCGLSPRIKWVNDLYLGGKKLCGILCEGCGEAAVVGVGLNLKTPEGGFPEDLNATALDVPVDRRALAEAITQNLLELCEKLPDTGFLAEYRANNLVLGKKITVVPIAGEPYDTKALDLDDRGRLVTVHGVLDSGEVSVRHEKERESMKYFLVDAFTDSLFSGNPAGVCVCEGWPSDDMMQRIAGENNLPETAFLCKEAGGWRIRWFTPAFEMDLCGHATLASGFVLMNILEPGDEACFDSCSGPVRVLRAENDRYVLDFPSRPPVEVPIPAGIEDCLGAKVLGCYQSRDMIVLLESADDVQRISPDFEKMKAIIPQWGMVPTAAGEDCDFVSRYFDPRDTNIEDPVTGSAHCTLTPFWAQRLGKQTLQARQLSARGGKLLCVDEGERVKIGGGAVLYLQGELHV